MCSTYEYRLPACSHASLLPSHSLTLVSIIPVKCQCQSSVWHYGKSEGPRWELWGTPGRGASKKKSNPIIGEWNHFTQMSISQCWQATDEINLQSNIKRRRPPPRPTHIKWIYLWLLKCCSYKDVSLPSKISLFPLYWSGSVNHIQLNRERRQLICGICILSCISLYCTGQPEAF